MSSANTRQPGGTHYKPGSKMQHWDWTVQVLCNSYLEGCVTKYVSRHRFKGTARLDLEKAGHYLQKLREECASGRVTAMHHLRTETNEMVVLLTDEFCRSAELNDAESVIMHRVATWRVQSDLEEVDRRIQELILNLNGETNVQ